MYTLCPEQQQQQQQQQNFQLLSFCHIEYNGPKWAVKWDIGQGLSLPRVITWVNPRQPPTIEPPSGRNSDDMDSTMYPK